MSISEMFSEFLGNLVISNTTTISNRYGELTSALNKKFRDTESKTANTLQVGSFGRKTGIDGISDLDMLYIMPKTQWDTYKGSNQSKLLNDTRNAILARYPNSKVKVDRLVVTVTYTNFHVEVQPVFEQENGSYKYPDTYGNGSWKFTKPKEEMDEISSMDTKKNSNLKSLCKMARAWKNKHGVGMGGLLLDTLAYNFLESTDEYDDKSYTYYDWLSRDFFKYLSEEPDQSYYLAPGSNQQVKVSSKFQKKAKKAYNLSLKAIESDGQQGVNKKWKKIYGRPFPAAKVKVEKREQAVATRSWDNTEEFIEIRFTVDIKYSLRIDCTITQNGFMPAKLRDILRRKRLLKSEKSLLFEIQHCTVPGDYMIYWKVLNRGEIAERRDCIRGQIVPDGGYHRQNETTNFKGDHVVECYAVKNGVVVAKDRIRVPIDPTAQYND